MQTDTTRIPVEAKPLTILLQLGYFDGNIRLYWVEPIKLFVSAAMGRVPCKLAILIVCHLVLVDDPLNVALIVLRASLPILKCKRYHELIGICDAVILICLSREVIDDRLWVLSV